MAKVMIVDDHEDIVETLKMIVEKEGHTTDCACNGEEFLAKTDEFKPDLVLLDVMMPGLTTKQILEKLKASTQHPKVILVTVVRFSDEEKNALVKEFNIADYVAKPFDIGDLLEKVRKHLA